MFLEECIYLLHHVPDRDWRLGILDDTIHQVTEPVPSGMVSHPGRLESRILPIVSEHNEFSMLDVLCVDHILGKDVNVTDRDGSQRAQR